MNKKWMIGNWKMNGSCADVRRFEQSFQNLYIDSQNLAVGLCVPLTMIAPMRKMMDRDGFYLGAQDCSQFKKGAYTGEVSAFMLSEAGVDLSIIGHSERRQYHAETNAIIAQKMARCFDHHIKVILCIGEDEDAYKNKAGFEMIEHQLQGCLSLDQADLEQKIADQMLVIAYEPVWAIGTNHMASAEYVQNMHQFIRSHIKDKCSSEFANKCPILYGGSLKASNCQQILTQKDVNGGLIGGASLDSQEFCAMIKIAQKIATSL